MARRETATRRVTVAKESDIAALTSRVLSIDGMEIALFRLSDGSFKAIENRCPHKGGKLSEGIVCDHYVFCPLHDWKIDLHDGMVQFPDEGCVERYDVEVEERTGKVVIFVPSSHHQSA